MTGWDYVLGEDIPDDEPLYDSAGRLVDDVYVDAAVADTRRRSDAQSGSAPVQGSGEARR